MSARVMRVIETTNELRGNGTPSEPFRRVTQYWTEEGTLLAERDPLATEINFLSEQFQQLCTNFSFAVEQGTPPCVAAMMQGVMDVLARAGIPTPGTHRTPNFQPLEKPT